MKRLRIFVGWDSREDIAFRVCKHSLESHSTISLEIVPIKQHVLRKQGLYWRPNDTLSSTEFSFTRFLTPYLAGFSGWALFVDCDFLFRKDIATLLDYLRDDKAIYCVQHKYKPSEGVKMDGQLQTVYPRKNWSSFMLMNCGHPDVGRLTPDYINTATGLELHRFQWLSDELIGSLPTTWNYLEGWHSSNDCDDPIAVHFTRGGPWFPGWQNVEYADEWIRLANKFGFYETDNRTAGKSDPMRNPSSYAVIK